MSGRNDDENLDSMSKEDLQRWIQAVVDKTPQLVQRQEQLAHLEEWVKMKERDATCTRLLYGNAFESVQECESVMKCLYEMLGMEYRDEDSEEEGIESHGAEMDKRAPCRTNDALALALLEDSPDTLDPMMEKVSMAIQKSSKLVQDLVQMVGHSSKSTSSLSDFSSRPSSSSTFEACRSESTTPTLTDAKHIKPLDTKSIFQIVKTESLVAGSPLIKTEPGLHDSQGVCDSKKGLLSDVKVKVEPKWMRSPQACDPHQSFAVKKSEEQEHSTEPVSTTTGSLNQTESEDTGTSSVGVDDVDFKVTAVTSEKSGSPRANSGEADDGAAVGSKSSRKKGKGKKRKKEISEPPSDMKKRLRSSTNTLPRKSLVLSSSEDELDDFDPVKDPSYFPSGAEDSEPSDSPPESPRTSPEASRRHPPPPPPPQKPPANVVIAPPPQKNPEHQVTAPQFAPAQKPPVCDKPVPVQERREVVLEVGTKVLAKSGPQTWSRGTVQHVTEEASARSYTVEFQDQEVKVVPAHQVAEDKIPMLKDLFVGCRVVASYKDKKKSGFNGGVMAELPERKNRMRFLVFYDDDTVAYLALPDFLIVCKQLDNVWTEIEDEALQKQVKDYLDTYPNPISVSLSLGQETKVTRNGQTEICEVKESDGSLVRLCYKKDKVEEWVYKGTDKLLHIAHIKQKLKEQSEKLQKTQQPLPSLTKPPTLNQTQQPTQNQTQQPTQNQTQQPTQNQTQQPTQNQSQQPTQNQTQQPTQNQTQQPTQNQTQQPTQNQTQQPTQSQAKPTTQNQSQDANRDKSQSHQPPSQSEKQDVVQQKIQVPQKAQQTDQVNNWTNQPNAQQMRPASASTGSVAAPLVSSSSCDISRVTDERSLPLALQPKVLLQRLTCTPSLRHMTLSSSSDEEDYDEEMLAKLTHLRHRCGPQCLDDVRPPAPDLHRGQNPLLIPLLFRFRRITARRRLDGTVSFHIFYRAPCGRSLCDMQELQDFLLETRCDFLFLDMFCTDPFILVNRARPPSLSPSPNLLLPDISAGRELLPVPCFNEVDHTAAPVIRYTPHRLPAPGVSINTSSHFLLGCDCTDGCRDRGKCSCHRLTIDATSLCSDGPVDASAGYTHKRLHTSLPTGVYECNALCGCDPRTCSNRLVQHGLQLRLELFMTQHKGWGVRCRDDVARGSFVCVFTGKVLTEDKVNEDEAGVGNDYLANLDFIEGAEKLKEGYESDAHCSDGEVDSPKKTLTMKTGPLMKKQLYDEESTSGEDDKDAHDQVKVSESWSQQLESQARLLADPPKRCFAIKSSQRRVFPLTSAEPRKVPSVNTRKLFNGEDACYIIDARQEGNIGRFINHSCSPNLFVQNVFVDTHDLRFPWVAFFASRRIRAGTELTWDYNYEVGSVEGKVVLCCCGSQRCTGRLL